MLRNEDELPPTLRSLPQGRLLADWMVWALSEAVCWWAGTQERPAAWSPAQKQEVRWLLWASSFGDLVTPVVILFPHVGHLETGSSVSL